MFVDNPLALYNWGNSYPAPISKKPLIDAYPVASEYTATPSCNDRWSHRSLKTYFALKRIRN